MDEKGLLKKIKELEDFVRGVDTTKPLGSGYKDINDRLIEIFKLINPSIQQPTDYGELTGNIDIRLTALKAPKDAAETKEKKYFEFLQQLCKSSKKLNEAKSYTNAVRDIGKIFSNESFSYMSGVKSYFSPQIVAFGKAVASGAGESYDATTTTKSWGPSGMRWGYRTAKANSAGLVVSTITPGATTSTGGFVIDGLGQSAGLSSEDLKKLYKKVADDLNAKNTAEATKEVASLDAAMNPPKPISELSAAFKGIADASHAAGKRAEVTAILDAQFTAVLNAKDPTTLQTALEALVNTDTNLKKLTDALGVMADASNTTPGGKEAAKALLDSINALELPSKLIEIQQKNAAAVKQITDLQAAITTPQKITGLILVLAGDSRDTTDAGLNKAKAVLSAKEFQDVLTANDPVKLEAALAKWINSTQLTDLTAELKKLADPLNTNEPGRGAAVNLLSAIDALKLPEKYIAVRDANKAAADSAVNIRTAIEPPKPMSVLISGLNNAVVGAPNAAQNIINGAEFKAVLNAKDAAGLKTALETLISAKLGDLTTNLQALANGTTNPKEAAAAKELLQSINDLKLDDALKVAKVPEEKIQAISDAREVAAGVIALVTDLLTIAPATTLTGEVETRSIIGAGALGDVLLKKPLQEAALNALFDKGTETPPVSSKLNELIANLTTLSSATGTPVQQKAKQLLDSVTALDLPKQFRELQFAKQNANDQVKNLQAALTPSHSMSSLISNFTSAPANTAAERGAVKTLIEGQDFKGVLVLKTGTPLDTAEIALNKLCEIPVSGKSKLEQLIDALTKLSNTNGPDQHQAQALLAGINALKLPEKYEAVQNKAPYGVDDVSGNVRLSGGTGKYKADIQGNIQGGGYPIYCPADATPRGLAACSEIVAATAAALKREPVLTDCPRDLAKVVEFLKADTAKRIKIEPALFAEIAKLDLTKKFEADYKNRIAPPAPAAKSGHRMTT